MKKLNNLGNDAERVTNGISYYISMTAIFLIMFFGACYILNSIIDPCIEMLEHLAENALKIGLAIAKILLVGVFMVAIYKVFFETSRKNEY